MGLMAPIVLSSMAKFGLKYLMKPKYEQPDLGYLDKHAAHLRSNVASKDTYHTTMRAVLKNIGRESGKMQRTIDYDTALRGESDSGVNIQKKISAHGKTISAMKDASVKASEMQATEDRRFHDQIDQVMLMKEKILADAKHRYGLEEDQWKREMITEGVSGALNIGLGAYQQAEGWKNAFETAKINDPGLTMEAFKGMGGTSEVALAKSGYDIGKGRTNLEFNIMSNLPGYSIDVIKDFFETGQLNENQARQIISEKLKSMNEDPNMLTEIEYDELGGYTETEIPNLPGDKYPETLKKKVIKPARKETKWEANYDQGRHVEYDVTTGKPTGNWYPLHEKDKGMSAGEGRSIAQGEAEREASIFNLTNDLHYRKLQDIGDTSKIDAIEELMEDGVDQFESKKASDLINTYVRSITEEDLKNIGLSEMSELNSIITDLFGGEISKLDAYRFKVRRDFKSAFDRYLRKGNFNPV